jgi:hypothetical protein
MKPITEVIDEQRAAEESRATVRDELVNHLFRFTPFKGIDEELLEAASEAAVATIISLDVTRREAQQVIEQQAAALEAERDTSGEEELKS